MHVHVRIPNAIQDHFCLPEFVTAEQFAIFFPKVEVIDDGEEIVTANWSNYQDVFRAYDDHQTVLNVSLNRLALVLAHRRAEQSQVIANRQKLNTASHPGDSWRINASRECLSDDCHKALERIADTDTDGAVKTIREHHPEIAPTTNPRWDCIEINLHDEPGTGKWEWGEDELQTENEARQVIADFLCDYLCSQDIGTVTGPTGTIFQIEIRAALV